MNDRKPRKNFVFRNYDLDIFDINPQMASEEEIIPYNRFSGSRINNFLSLVKLKFLGSKYHVLDEKKYFIYDPKILDAGDNSYLIGYWQSYQYFTDVADVVKRDFKIITALGTQAGKMLSRIKDVDSVCLNVRRTDFLGSAHGTCGLDYYRQALEVIKGKVAQPVVFVFSDDIQWCIDNI